MGMKHRKPESRWRAESDVADVGERNPEAAAGPAKKQPCLPCATPEGSGRDSARCIGGWGAAHDNCSLRSS